MHRHHSSRVIRTICRIVIVCHLGCLSPLYANPLGGSVVGGSASIDQSNAAVTNIHQTSDRAIINWTGFSNSAGELIRFIQPGAQSVALNRVTGSETSVINGALTANGQVFLLNPNGVLFGKTAQVNVGGLVASSLDMKNSDFMSGKYNLQQGAGRLGSVVNQGKITAAPGGAVVLVAPFVNNEGEITAPGGRVALTAGTKAEVNLDDAGLVSVVIGADVPRPITLTREAVSELLHTAVNNDHLSGAVSVTEVDGKIILGGAEGIAMNQGKISVDAAGGAAASSAGRVRIDSTHVTLLAPGSIITANGKGSGSNGGDVRILSSGTTVTSGRSKLEAMGADEGGDGGLVEVSGKHVVAAAVANTSAVAGRRGTYLLDPVTLTITNDPPAGDWDGDATFATGDAAGGTVPAATDKNALVDTISAEAIATQSAFSDITLEATTAIVFANTAGAIQLGAGALGGGASIKFSTTTAGGTISGAAGAMGVSASGSGTVTFDTTGGGAIAGGAIDLTNIPVNAGSGDIVVRAGGDVTLGALTTSSTATVTAGDLTGAGAIIVGAGRVTAGTINADSRTGMGIAGTPLQFAATIITADNAESGDVIITNTLGGTVTVNSLTTVGAGGLTFTQSGGGAVTFATDIATTNGSITLANTETGLALVHKVQAGGDWNVALTAEGALSLGDDPGDIITTARSVRLQAAGNVTQTAPIRTGQQGLVLLGTGTFTLDNADNAVLRLATANTVGAVTYVDRAFIDADGVNTAGNAPVSLKANFLVCTDVSGSGVGINAGSGQVTLDIATFAGDERAPITAGSLLLLGTAAYMLDNADNAVLKIATANTVGAVTYVDRGALDVGIDNAPYGGIRTAGNAAVSLKADSLTFRDRASSGIGINAGSGKVTLDVATAAGDQSAAITAGSLLLLGTGAFTLDHAGNAVVKVATASTVGAVTYVDRGALDVGTVGGVNGITTAGGGSVSLKADSLTFSQSLSAPGGLVTLDVVTTAGTETGSITAGGLLLAGTGAFTLDNPGNAVVRISTANAVGAVTYVDSGSLDVGGNDFRYMGITTANDAPVSLKAYSLTLSDPAGTGYGINAGNGQVTLDVEGTAGTQRTPITAGSLLLKGSGAFTLDNPGNAVVRISTANAVGAVTYVDSGSLDVGGFDPQYMGITTADNAPVSLKAHTLTFSDPALTGYGINAGNGQVTLDVEGTVGTQRTPITAGSLLLKGTGAFTLNNPNNVVVTIATASTVGAVTYVDSGALDVGTVGGVDGITTQGGVAVTLKANSLTFSQSLSAAGGLVTLDVATTAETGEGSITAGGLFLTGMGAFTLDNPDNAVGRIATSYFVGTVTYADGGALEVASLEGWDGIETTSGAITLSTYGGNDLTLGQPVRAPAGTVTLNSSGAIRGTGIVTARDINADARTGMGTSESPLQFASAIISADNAVSGDVVITNTLGDLATVNSLTTAGEGGLTFVQAGGGAVDFTTDIATTSGSIILANSATSLSLLHKVQAGGAGNYVALIANGALSLGDDAADVVTAPGNVGLQAAQAVTQAAPITADGLLLKGIGGASFDLTDPANNVAILAATSAGAITYRDADSLAIGTLTVPPIGTVTGVDSGGNPIDLQSGSLALEQSVTAAGSTVRITVFGDLERPDGSSGSISAARADLIATGGVGTETEPVDTSVGTLTVSAGPAGAFIDQQGDLTLSGSSDGPFVLVAESSLTLLTLTAGGLIDLNASGWILDGGGEPNLTSATENYLIRASDGMGTTENPITASWQGSIVIVNSDDWAGDLDSPTERALVDDRTAGAGSMNLLVAALASMTSSIGSHGDTSADDRQGPAPDLISIGPSLDEPDRASSSVGSSGGTTRGPEIVVY